MVQVDGRVRERLSVPVAIPDEEARAMALASPQVQKFLDGKEGGERRLRPRAAGEHRHQAVGEG